MDIYTKVEKQFNENSPINDRERGDIRINILNVRMRCSTEKWSLFIIAPTVVVSQTFSHPRIHIYGYSFIEQYVIELLKHRGRAAIGANFYIISYISWGLVSLIWQSISMLKRIEIDVDIWCYSKKRNAQLHICGRSCH